MDNCLVTVEKVLVIEGFGENLNKAVEDAFLHMRKELNDTIKKPIISINTTKVVNLGILKSEKEEAFLYVLFKRKVLTYSLKLEIYLTINLLELEG